MDLGLFWNSLIDIINGILSKVFFFLPVDPLKDGFDALTDNEWIQMLNWFIPVGEILTYVTIWIAAVGSFYVYQIILRWIKAIGD